jgi:integrase
LKQRSQFNGPNDPVFATGNKPIHYDVSLRKLKKAGKLVGIPWINWHALRRFFANISDEFGMPERQYMLGHAGGSAITQHYTTSPEIDRKRPYVQRITRALLDAGVTTALPPKSKFNA